MEIQRYLYFMWLLCHVAIVGGDFSKDINLLILVVIGLVEVEI